MKIRRTARFTFCLILAMLAAALTAHSLTAQEGNPDEAAMMAAMQKAMTPGAQHAHLAELAGKWKATVKMWGDPSAPPSMTHGTAERTMILGGRVLEEKFTAPMPEMGATLEGVGYTGYDNVTGKYWATWFDNMSTSLATMEGTIDEATGKSTFEGDATDPMAGKKMPMRIESHVEDGKEIAEFYMTGPEGKSFKSMEIVYERQ